jgi:L-cysteine S-thiosulfotransferase
MKKFTILTTHTIALAVLAGATVTFGDTNQAQTISDDNAVQGGFRIIADQRQGNCMACHSMPDAQGKKVGIQSTFAPPLDGVANRYDADTLRQWVADARKINPQTLMPPFATNGMLSASQIDDVLAALLTLK